MKNQRVSLLLITADGHVHQPVAVDQQPIRYCRIDVQCVAYVAPKKRGGGYIKIVITTILMSLSGKHIMKIIYSNTSCLRNTAVPSKLRGTGYASPVAMTS